MLGEKVVQWSAPSPQSSTVVGFECSVCVCVCVLIPFMCVRCDDFLAKQMTGDSAIFSGFIFNVSHLLLTS